jgi:SAM-dependent methyltransferase
MNVSQKSAATREEILEANLRSHHVEAAVYDIRHGEIFNLYEQAVMKALIRKGLSALRKSIVPGAPVEFRVLDGGCGTGNAGIKFLKSGARVDAVDLSPDMVEVMKKKIGPDLSRRARLIRADIDSYLDSVGSASYDVIAFSSLLHHLPEYQDTIAKAAVVLKRPGLFFIFHEPLPDDQSNATALSARMRAVDRFVWKYEGKILRKNAPAEPILPADADLTDYHVRRGGLDLNGITDRIIQAGGLIIALRSRSQNMRHTWSSCLDNVFRLRKDGFHLIALFEGVSGPASFPNHG